MLKIIATLCRIADPTNCHDVTLTTSDIQDLTMTTCLVGQPALADWMQQHPNEWLAGWKCQVGAREQRGI